jgi:hypothetical protein
MNQVANVQDMNIEVEYVHTVTEAAVKPVYVEVGFICCAESNVNVLRAKLEDRLNNPFLLQDLLGYLQHYSTVADVIPSCKLQSKFNICFSSDEDGVLAEVVVNMLLLVRDHSNDWIEKAFNHWVSGSFASYLTLNTDTVSVQIYT